MNTNDYGSTNDPSTLFNTPEDSGIELAPVDEVRVDQMYTSNAEINKFEKLEKAKANKLYALSNVKNKANLDNSYTDLGDGRVESNRNKIWNDLSDYDFQSLWNSTLEDQRLTKDEQGRTLDSQGNVYNGRTRRLYDFGTKVQTGEERKIGLARGDAEDATARYTKYPSGELGADINRMYGDVLLPNNVATMLEATLHGRKRSIENRSVKDRYEDPELADLYGGGSSEYYTSKVGAFGEEMETSNVRGKALFEEYMSKLPEKYNKYSGSSGNYDPTLKPIGNRALNTIAGFASSFVSELIVNPLDALGDATGLYDLGTEESKSKTVNSMFNYNSRAVEESMHVVGEKWDKVSDSSLSTADRVRAAAEGILEAVTTPEMLGTSLGALLSWATPGTALKLFGVGAKYSKIAKGIDAEVRAGTKTAAIAKAEKRAAYMSSDGAKDFLVGQSGQVTAALGNINNQYEQFVQNNNDIELEGAEKAKWIAGRFAVQMVNQNLDKFVDMNIMKSPATLTALVPAVKAMTNKEFSNAALMMSKGLAKSTIAGGSEAAQEYAQTSMELFNSRFGAETFKDEDTFIKFLSNEDNLREAGIASLAGAGGSLQFEAAGSVGKLATGLVGSAASKAQKIVPSTSTPAETQNSQEKPVTEEEVVAAKKRYKDVLTSVATSVAENGVKESNVGEVIESLDELEATKSVISTATPEQIKNANDVYNGVVKELENFITKNPELKLSKRSVKTLQKSEDGKETVSETEDMYNDTNRPIVAEKIIHTILGSGKAYEAEFEEKMIVFGIANGLKKSKVAEIIKSYTSVEEEATTGKRGYVSRLNRLKSLVTSSNPNSKEAVKEQKNLLSMSSAVQNSVNNLTVGIEGAKAEAAKHNKTKVHAKKTYPFTTEYKKDDGSLFTITVKKVGNTWVADTANAEKILGLKQKYMSDIKQGLREVSELNKGKIPNVGSSLNAVTIPVKESKYKKQRLKDAKYVSEVNKLMDDVIPDHSGVNKVILGKTTHSKWDAKGDYYKTNSLLINGPDYNSNDVVMLDSTEVKTFKNKENGKTNYSPVLGNEALAALKAAIAAGATIVLDSDLANPYDKKANPLAQSALSGYITRHKDYERLDSVGQIVFVKKTEENSERIVERKAKLAKQKEEHTTKTSNKDRLVSLRRSIDTGVDLVDGSELSEERRTELSQEFESLKDTVNKDSFDNDKDKIDRFLEREPNDAVAKAAAEVLNDTDPDVINYEDKSFQAAVKAYIAKEQVKDQTGIDLLKSWDEISKDALIPTADKKKGILEVLKSASLTAMKAATDILGERSFSKGKKDIYEKVYKKAKTGEEVIVPSRKELTEKEIDKLFDDNNKESGNLLGNKKEKHIFVGIRRTVQDISKIATVSKTTVVNSIPLDYMPFSVRDSVATFSKAASSILAKVNEAELAEQSDVKNDKNGYVEGNFNLHNSPARGLFFNNEGKVNEEVITAMYLSIGEVIANDSVAFSRGYKPDIDVAKMFNVQESELTNDMRQFAYTHGTLLKTAADSIGKDILKQLGISKIKNSETAAYEYEVLIADVGNTAIKIAEKAGLLKNTAPKSNQVATLYRDGEIRDTEEVTYYIHIDDKPEMLGKYSTNVMSDSAVSFKEAYKEVAELIPESSTKRVEPSFTPPDEDRLAKATTTVRNDIAGKEVPVKAQKSLEHLMDTPYSVDLDAVTEFLENVDKEGSKIKSLLGFVELESDKFDDLYFKDKEVQEGKNRDIEKSIDELRRLKKKIEDQKLHDTPMYFDYFYASNDRYMIDSNTINSQTDKLHRFFVVPSGHKLNYGVSKSKEGGLLFNVVSNESELDNDQSYTVRMALAQAFGADVDKMNAPDIIEFGNAVLSMNKKQIQKAKESILETGEFSLVVNGNPLEIKASDVKETDASLDERKGEAAHLSHTLQALKFLDDVQNALEGDGKITSSLSLEFDSLTSGFANKTQQMPILEDMWLHFARTGVLTDEYLELLKNAADFKGKGSIFDVKAGDAMGDVIATADFNDSYVAMGDTTIRTLIQGDKQKENLTESAKEGARSGQMVFDIIKPLLPGGEFIGVGDVVVKITKAIRNLFKNPFMIFNYSAGIARIVKNLSSNVAHDVAKGIATADFNDEDKKGIEAVAENLVKKVGLIHPDKKENGRLIKSAKELQQVLTNFRISKIRLKNPILVDAKAKAGDKGSSTLEHLLETTVGLTYGEVVKDVFQKSFEPFIKVQDSMNDAFKVAFRVFDKKRVDMLSKIQKDKEDHFLTIEDHTKVLEDLWDDFPWIMGPLSDTSTKAGMRDVIAVVTSGVKTPKAVDQSRKAPQAPLAAGESNDSRKVSPLIRYLEEAVSSGSVLPFHAIDGAEISMMLESMERDIAAIHDAVIPPLNKSDKAGFAYNKSMSYLNSNYVLADKLLEMAGRMRKTLESENFSKDFKEVSVKGIKLVQDDTDSTSFAVAAFQVVEELENQMNFINTRREEWYGDGGKLENAWIGNLVGTPGGMYKKGMDGPDLSYKKAFKNKYKNLSVTLKEKPKAGVTKVTGHKALLKDLANRLGSQLDDESIVKELNKSVKTVKKMIKHYSKKRDSIKDKALVAEIDSMLKQFLSMAPDATIDDITDISTSAGTIAAFREAIEKDLEGCK